MTPEDLKRVSPELRSMIEYASEAADKIFRKKGQVLPMYHVVSSIGRELVFPPPPGDKDSSMALIRAAFEILEVVRYVSITEAWTLDARSCGPEAAISPADLEKIQRDGVSSHPDRREIVLFNGEDHTSGQIMARRFILRPERGRPSLSPLEWTILPMPGAHMEGRMVGLLPAAGRAS